MSHLFASCGQSIGASASALVFPMNIQGWLPLGLTSLILRSKGLSRFLYSTTIDIWGQIILCGGGCPVQYRMFSSIPTLHPWEARRTPFFPSYESQNCFQTLPNAPWWRCLFQLEGRVEISTSLVVQWLRICLPIQGTWVQSLVWEDYTCWGRPESRIVSNTFLLIPLWVRWQRTCLHCRRPRFHPCIGKTSWRRAWLPTPVSLPGRFHVQRSLAGYSPWGRKESDMTERLTFLSSK